MSDQNVLKKPVSRRDFLKTLGAAGASAAFLSAIPAVALGRVEKTPQASLPLAADAGDQLAALGKDVLLGAYSRMVKSRKWETTIKDVRLGGEPMYGSWYPYIGQEAVSNGVVLALNNDDYATATHRGQGLLVAKGGDLNKIAAEIFFRTTGSNKGYGGTMHVIQNDKGLIGNNGIVGGGFYAAAGAAYASLVKGSKQVAVAFAGDGASSSVYFFSAVRSATKYNLPAIFVIENNLYAASVSIKLTAPVENLCDYTKSIQPDSVFVDGNDIAAVYAVAKAAVDKARAGKGPTVIEAKTYRWYDHYNFAGSKIGVDGAWGLPYRSDDELKQWMARDPIKRFREFLISKNIATDSDLTKLESDQQAVVDAAIKFAKDGPHPKPEDGLKNVYTGVSIPATQWLDAQASAT